jgi:hypothetical protein
LQKTLEAGRCQAQHHFAKRYGSHWFFHEFPRDASTWRLFPLGDCLQAEIHQAHNFASEQIANIYYSTFFALRQRGIPAPVHNCTLAIICDV